MDGDFQKPVGELAQVAPRDPVAGNDRDEDDKRWFFDGALLLYRRKEYASPVWSYRLRLTSGKYERRSTGHKKLDDAVRFSTDRYQEVKWREKRGLSATGFTFAEAAQEFIQHLEQQELLRNGKRRTAIDLTNKLVERHLIPFFGEQTLSDITMLDIRRYQETYFMAWRASRDQSRVVQRKGTNRRRQYDEPLLVNMPGTSVRRPSLVSQKNHQATIKRIFALAVTNAHVASHEIPAFSGTKVVLRRRGAFSDAELQRVLARLQKRVDETIYSHHRAARRLLWLYVRLVLLTGLRPGIESDLTFGDFTFRDGEHPHYLVRVNAGKTGPRTVVASSEVGEVLAAIRNQHPSPEATKRLWVKPNGTETIRLGAQFHTVLLSLGLARDADGNVRSLYSLRHTYATRRLDAQTAIDKLALNMGTSVQMIQAHYGHVQVEHHARELTKGASS